LRGTLVLAAEATYLVIHVPFCGHATIAAHADRDTIVPDPHAEFIQTASPAPKFDAVLRDAIDAMAQDLN
jgi:predicted PhzF superfamily epimerase YddE/YHI9